MRRSSRSMESLGPIRSAPISAALMLRFPLKPPSRSGPMRRVCILSRGALISFQFPIKFLVDTGASTVAMNKHQAKRLGLDYKLDSVEGQASTASGIARAYYLTLKRVRVGEIELKEVPAVVV